MQTKEIKAGYGTGRAAVGEVVDLIPPQASGPLATQQRRRVTAPAGRERSAAETAPGVDWRDSAYGARQAGRADRERRAEDVATGPGERDGRGDRSAAAARVALREGADGGAPEAGAAGGRRESGCGRAGRVQLHLRQGVWAGERPGAGRAVPGRPADWVTSCALRRGGDVGRMPRCGDVRRFPR